jgi:methionine-rich copper-binding protein CopC
MNRTLALVLAVLLSLGAVAVAFAHAEPVKVAPGDGAVLNVPPREVVIEMSQEMARQAGANDIEVFDAAGKKVTTVAAVIDNGNRARLSVPLPDGLATGVYTVKWKTLSADDGDPAEGTLTFTFDPAKPPSPGKTVLRDTGIGGTPASDAAATPSAAGDGSNGTSWVLVVAVAVAMLALGSGATFLLIKKAP